MRGQLVAEAHAHFEAGEFAAAAAAYTLALEAAATADRNLLASRAAAHLHLHNFAAARDDASAVLEKDPACIRCYMLRAKAFRGLKLYPQAIADLRQVLASPGKMLDAACQEMVACQAALNRKNERTAEELHSGVPWETPPRLDRAQQCLSLFSSLPLHEQQWVLEQSAAANRPEDSRPEDNRPEDSHASLQASGPGEEAAREESGAEAGVREPLTLSTLPADELLAILCHLDATSLARCSSTSRHLRQVCVAHDMLWERSVLRDFAPAASVHPLLPVHNQWRHMYAYLAQRQRDWDRLTDRINALPESDFLKRLKDGAWPEHEACHAWEHNSRNSTPIWYRYDELAQKWMWTPDLLNWMSADTLAVAGGAFAGERAAEANVRIIEVLQAAPGPMCASLPVRFGARAKVEPQPPVGLRQRMNNLVAQLQFAQMLLMGMD